MKYTQLIIGLLAGTALGGSVVAATGSSAGSLGGDAENVKKIVREVIMAEPKLIMESVQKFQIDQQKQQAANASEALKDKAIRELVYNDPNAAHHGPKDSKRVVAEFFDYNCGACKMMFKSIDELVKKDKDVRVVFHEYPIFGPVSDANSKLGFAVNRLYEDKYYEFHTKLMTHQGRVDEKIILDYAKELGMDPEKLKAEAAKKEVADLLVAARELGAKLNIQGTPTLAIGDEIVPHGMSYEDLEARMNAAYPKQ
jgi:protein-disulfide isomerase